MVIILQAYCFFGKELLDQEKCGDSIKVLEHAQACETRRFYALAIPYKVLVTELKYKSVFVTVLRCTYVQVSYNKRTCRKTKMIILVENSVTNDYTFLAPPPPPSE